MKTTKTNSIHPYQAFTLIELLVVISIIAVLMGILMPSLKKARDQAREVSCKANLKGIGLGINMYLQDNEHRLPDTQVRNGANNACNGHLWFRQNSTIPLKITDERSYWGIHYIDYIQERKTFGCASFRQFSQLITQEMLYGGDPKLIWESAFAVNGWLSKEKVTAIPRISEVLIAQDHVEPRIENGNQAGNSDMLFPSPSGINLTHYRKGGGRANWYRGIFRHGISQGGNWKTGGRLNALWLDGHVSSIRETTGGLNGDEEVLKRWYDPLKKHP